MSAIELLPQGRKVWRPAATPYEWPTRPGVTDTMRTDLSWAQTELGTPAAAAKDLLRILAAAYLADRTTSRPQQTLHRDIQLAVHVEAMDVWTQTALDGTVDLLHWLTGDTWTLEVQAVQPPAGPPEPPTDDDRVDTVSLLSGGLDSLRRIATP